MKISSLLIEICKLFNEKYICLVLKNNKSVGENWYTENIYNVDGNIIPKKYNKWIFQSTIESVVEQLRNKIVFSKCIKCCPPKFICEFEYMSNLEFNILMFGDSEDNNSDALEINDEFWLKIAFVLCQNHIYWLNEFHSNFVFNMKLKSKLHLNTIINSLKDLATKIDDKIIDVASDASSELSYNISDIIELSKLVLGSLTLNKSITTIDEIIRAAISSCQMQLQSKDMISYHIEDNVPKYIFTDGSRVQQVIYNLLKNSINSIVPNSTPHINIYVTSTILPSDIKDIYLVEFTVSDFGSGITHTLVKNIFDSFWMNIDSCLWSESDSANNLMENTGLGLAISNKLCKLLGGDLWLDETKDNSGTSIKFNIKVTADEYPSYISMHSLRSIKNKRVLVIEPLAEYRISIVLTLRKWGIVVNAVQTAIEAFELYLSRERYDLIILNESCDMKSSDVIYNVKEHHPSTIFVIIGAYVDTNDNLTKIHPSLKLPVSAKDLLECVTKVLSCQRILIPSEISILIIQNIKSTLLENLLRVNGYTKITIKNDAKEAYSMIQAFPLMYDVIIIDYKISQSISPHLMKMPNFLLNKNNIIVCKDFDYSSLIKDVEKIINENSTLHSIY
jgi:CheY-like chemotaxis protein